MHTNAIASDATLRSVWGLLSAPSTFIPAAFGVIHLLQKDDSSVLLRLGVTGTGKLPNYRIESGNSHKVLDAFDGNTHKPWPEGSPVREATTWSSEAMSYHEVRTLLEELRQQEKAKRS